MSNAASVVAALSAFGQSWRCALSRGALAVLLLVLPGCTGRVSDFTAGRVADTCNGTWPACDRVTGCLLGAQSYVEGRLPGTTSFLVQLAEPSKVRVHLLLEEVGAAGEETVFVFHEDRCRARVREVVSGRVLVAENEQMGEVVREAELVGVGDHLIELRSDARARYVLKVDVEPTRPE